MALRVGQRDVADQNSVVADHVEQADRRVVAWNRDDEVAVGRGHVRAAILEAVEVVGVAGIRIVGRAIATGVEVDTADGAE